MKHNIAAILLLLFMPLTLRAQNKIVIFANNFEPYYSENLPNYGPFLAIVQTALQRAGYETQIEFLPWARIIAEAEQGQCDVIAGVWFNRGREAWLVLSDPVLSNELGLLKLKDDPLRFTDLESLARQGVVVGNVSGYINPPSVEQAGVKVEYVTTDLLNLKKLYARRIRLAIMEKKTGDYLIESEGLTGRFEWVATLQTLSLCAGIVKKPDGTWRTLLSILNARLAEMRADGTWQELTQGLR